MGDIGGGWQGAGCHLGFGACGAVSWDRAIWHDREWLFGGGLDVGGAAVLIVPLLATPQLAHYVLDAFLWRRSANPRLPRLL